MSGTKKSKTFLYRFFVIFCLYTPYNFTNEITRGVLMLAFLIGLLSNFFCFILGLSTNGNFPPPLSSSEERECFLRMKSGDAAARNKLIEHNLRLVAHIVRKYYSSKGNQDDLISIGSIGLIKAVDSFNSDNGARFATYASKCIQNEILMYFRSQKKLSNEVSINETIDMDRDGNPLTYIDIISVDDTIADDIYKKIRTKEAMDIIKKKLSARERQIVLLRYGLSGGRSLTQREVAENLGISRSYVSRIEKAALEKIQNEIK